MVINVTDVNYFWSWKQQFPPKPCNLTQLSIKKLLLKDILYHISQLHVSARFYGAANCCCMSLWHL